MRRISDKDLAMLRARPIVLSASGGKDSTAAGLLLVEHDLPFQAVFADTGWEHRDDPDAVLPAVETDQPASPLEMRRG